MSPDFSRTILHIDQNAFFASVEQQANPELRGKPIAVVGAAHRTVITTASYEARKYGVKTGMAIWEGKRACPDLIIVRGDNKKYTYTSSEIVRMMLEYVAENGDLIRQLIENDRLWSGWQNWQDYLNSPDGARATEEEAVNGCQSNGALIDRPL